VSASGKYCWVQPVVRESQRYQYDPNEQLDQHFNSFVSACNFGRRLKPSKASHQTNSAPNHTLGHGKPRQRMPFE